MRVDVFRNSIGQYVVNEFESLEADFHSSRRGMDDVQEVNGWLGKYYTRVLNELLSVVHVNTTK